MEIHTGQGCDALIIRWTICEQVEQILLAVAKDSKYRRRAKELDAAGQRTCASEEVPYRHQPVAAWLEGSVAHCLKDQIESATDVAHDEVASDAVAR